MNCSNKPLGELLIFRGKDTAFKKSFNTDTAQIIAKATYGNTKQRKKCDYEREKRCEYVKE